MREIEIKLRAENLGSVEAKLKELGCEISAAKTQTDINFVHKDDVRWFEETTGPFAYPRLRLQDGQNPILTVKKPIENEMDCAEYEVSLKDEKEVKGLMQLLDYTKGVVVKKTRKTCTYNDYTITLDEVDGLGSFIEIEKVVEDGDALATQKEMFAFAKETFDLDPDDEVMKGYDILLYYASR